MTGADLSWEGERRRKSKCGGPHQCRPPVGWQFVTSIRFHLIQYRTKVVGTGDLDHPNIVKVFGFDDAEGRSFLILQFFDGEAFDTL